MLSFPAASEPGKMLVETLQWKVSQCVTADFSSFAPVQSYSGFFEFCSGSDAWAVLLRVWWIPLPEVLQGTFAFCGVPNPVGI